MSYQIEVGKFSARIVHAGCPDLFVVYQLAGDNNLIDEDNRFVRSWDALCFGGETSIVKSAAKAAEAADGGGIRPLRGRAFSKDSYLKGVRKLTSASADLSTVLKYQPNKRWLNEIYLYLPLDWIQENKLRVYELVLQCFKTEEIEKFENFTPWYDASRNLEPSMLKIPMNLVDNPFLNRLLELDYPVTKCGISLQHQPSDMDHYYFKVLRLMNTNDSEFLVPKKAS